MNRTRPDFDDTEADKGLQRLFESATEAYDAGRWGSATVLGGRALRALAESLVPESSREETLAAQLVEALEHHDLEGPVLTVASAFRRKREFLAYLEGEEEDADVADTLLEITGCLIQYLHILPRRIERLSARLTK